MSLACRISLLYLRRKTKSWRLYTKLDQRHVSWQGPLLQKELQPWPQRQLQVNIHQVRLLHYLSMAGYLNSWILKASHRRQLEALHITIIEAYKLTKATATETAAAMATEAAASQHTPGTTWGLHIVFSWLLQYEDIHLTTFPSSFAHTKSPDIII